MVGQLIIANVPVVWVAGEMPGHTPKEGSAPLRRAERSTYGLLRFRIFGPVTTSPEILLHPITRENLGECLRLTVAEEQQHLVASNAKSLAQAYVNSDLHPFAIYSGGEDPVMVGFCMYEMANGTGYIQRLMIGHEHQQRGYGRAAMDEVIRRLQDDPTVTIVATSHRRSNEPAAKLYASLGFVSWDVEWAGEDPEEVYLRLHM